jgi:Flp pilus assembly protein TadG
MKSRPSFRRATPNDRNERGGSAVEFALIVPIIVALVFGIIEFSLVLKNTNILSNAASAGARLASIESRTAEYHLRTKDEIIQEVADKGLVLKKLVIYKADKNTGLPKNGSATTPNQLAIREDYSSCISGCFVWQGNTDGTYTWLRGTPTQIADATTLKWPWYQQASCGPSATTDYVGVWVEYEHNYITGFFGSTKTIRQRAVYRLEPTEFSNITQCNGTSPTSGAY